MDLADILEHLREQRDSLNAAISALEGTPQNDGRRRTTPGRRQLARRRRRLSAAAKKRISEAAKARWAKAKKAGRNTL
jgi:hypothetical protein